MPVFPTFTGQTQALQKALKSLQQKHTKFTQVILTLLHQNEGLSNENLALQSDLYTISQTNSFLRNVISIQSSQIEELLFETRELKNLYITTRSSKLGTDLDNTFLVVDNTILCDENVSLHQQNNALCTILSILIAVSAFSLVYLDSLSLESAQSLPCI